MTNIQNLYHEDLNSIQKFNVLFDVYFVAVGFNFLSFFINFFVNVLI